MKELPPHMPSLDAIVVDPMLATGDSAIAAVDRVKETEPKSLEFVCVLASRARVETFPEHHPDAPVFAAGVDDGLDDKGYIVPGLGDAGDRLYRAR